MVKTNQLCKVEPLSILLKMACKNVRSQMTTWWCACMLQLFKGGGHVCKKRQNFGLSGVLFFIEVRQKHRQQCAGQCPTIEKDVSTLLLFFSMPFFSNFSKEHMLKMAYLFWLFSCLTLIQGQCPSYPLKLESKPCNNIFGSINTIAEDSTVKSGKEIK